VKTLFKTESGLIALLDAGLMGFYRHTRQTARRSAQLVVLLLPLMALLVGSCKTSQAPAALSAAYGADIAFQAALFPDRPAARGNKLYTPAAGYVSEARTYVEAHPSSMLMLGRDEIGYLFGKPAFSRRDADAEVWQYKTAACVVEFYFYKGEKVAHMEARRKDLSPVNPGEESQCIGNIRKQSFSAPA